MVARAAATSTRALLRRSARLPPRSTRPAPARTHLHISASTLSPTPTAPLDEVIPGATYVHIPPLEIPAEGLVPLQGSNTLMVRCGESPISLTVAHSLTIVKAIEAKCGPVVSVHHRRDPVNGTMLKGIHVTLLHPITLTKPLVLEIPCHSIPRETRMTGGPSLADLERAILEPPSATGSAARPGKNPASSSTQNQRVDLIYVEVKTVEPKRNTQLTDASAGRGRKPSTERRFRKSPEDELEEDEEILGRLLEWNGFHGGFQGLQAAYKPLSQVLPHESSSADRGTTGPVNTPDVGSIAATDAAAHEGGEEPTLEERLSAEREFWRTRREMEKNARREGETGERKDAALPSKRSTTPSRWLPKEDASSIPSSTPSSPTGSSPPTPPAPSAPQPRPTDDHPPALSKAEQRLVEQVRYRAQADSSPSAKLLKVIGGTSQQPQPSKQSATAIKGFTGASGDSARGKQKTLTEKMKGAWADWFSS